MRSKMLLAALLFVLFAQNALALPARLLDAAQAVRLEQAAARGEKVTLHGLPLGNPALDSIALEPMQVWAPDAKIVVYDGAGQETVLPPPAIQNFRGRVVGDEDSTVFISVTADHEISGTIFTGTRKYVIGRAVRRSGSREPMVDRQDREAPFALAEIDDIDEGSGATFSCGVEKNAYNQSRITIPGSPSPSSAQGKLRARTEAGSVSGATYQMLIAIETDTELYAAFGSTVTLTTYLNNLVGAGSTIYQRDLHTTLTIGTVHLYSGGTDPWAATSDTDSALAEFGTYWHNNYLSVPRSSAVFISGKGFNGGVAWSNTICGGDFSCGATGASCGDPLYANKYAGAYAFCGSFSGLITTTLPDPTLTQNGVQYGLPANNNFWMLLEFVHELGHNANGPHTHCVALSAADQTKYSTSRGYVDECASGECFVGATSFPPELGTIMSYCHNIFYSGSFRASRYLFGKAGEASEKMLPYFTAGFESNTANPTVTFSDAGTIPCSAGRTASVASCSGCTYSWAISGGLITAGNTSNVVTFTPSGSSVTLTPTVTRSTGCGITAPRTATAACGAITAPTGLVATATGSTTVAVSWNAVAGAASYQIWRKGPLSSGSFAQIGTSLTTNYTDNGGTLGAGNAYLYQVKAVDAGANVSAASASDLATTVVFTDSPLVAQTTPVKAAHLNELRTATNALQLLAGQTTSAYTDSALSVGSTTVQAVHVTEIRTRMNTARTALSLATISFTSTPVAGSSVIAAIDISEMRTGVQ